MLLQRIVKAKSEKRKAMLSGYMQALDESEGLQQTITRLADRMGVGEGLMHIMEFAKFVHLALAASMVWLCILWPWSPTVSSNQ